VLLRMSKSEEPRWFHIQYEKLPFYCFECGIMGHSEVECLHPVERDEQGHSEAPFLFLIKLSFPFICGSSKMEFGCVLGIRFITD
jgi:hypothetical protein